MDDEARCCQARPRDDANGEAPSPRRSREARPVVCSPVEAREAPLEELALTLFDRIFREAASTFSKRNGHASGLTPFSRTWQTVIERADHAIWVWNDKYGPLNAAQREYAGDLICDALRKGGAAPTPGDHYAYFHQRLTTLLNHESVHAGFRRREEDVEEMPEEVGGVLDDLYAGIAA